MIDPRFYEALGPYPAAALAGGDRLEGDPDAPIGSVAPLSGAGPGDAAFVDAKRAPRLPDGIGLLFAPLTLDLPRDAARAIVRTAYPRAAFSAAARRLYRERMDWAGEPVVEAGAEIGPGVILGGGARIGAGAVIEPGAVIGPGVTIGRRTRIGARTVVLFALVGDDVTVLPGSVIGAPGFGVAPGPSGPVDLVQLGRAILQDRCSIGALSTVDRGALGDTVVGEDAKIDNHCQIAHNVVVGRGVIMAAYAGISGSVTIGDGAMLGGRVGVADHVTVGAGARLAAGSGLLQDVPAGEAWGGYPAAPMRSWLRERTWLRSAARGARKASEDE